MPLGRAGRKTQTDETTRRCIATGEVQPCTGMFRFVLSPDGVVTPDLAERLPGRGIWVSADRAALDLAIKKKLFSRAAKTQATIPDGLLEMLEQLMVRRLVDLISLARRGGNAICGFEKTKGALISEAALVLLQSKDGSDPQKSKLRPPSGQNTYISCLTASELGLAFGRDYVIHAALVGGGLTKSVKREAARLAGLRGRDAITEAKQPDNPAVKG
nr:RNA-binding protein [Amylibacter sp.]